MTVTVHQPFNGQSTIKQVRDPDGKLYWYRPYVASQLTSLRGYHN